MRNFRTLFTLALLGAVSVVPAALAQGAAPAAGPTLTAPTIAVVDMQRVLVDSAAGRSLQSQLDVERRKIRDQLAKLEEELKNGENNLQRQRSVLAPDALNEQAQALGRKRADAQRTAQELQDQFAKGQNDAVNVVIDNIRDIAQQIANERRIGLVVSKQIVISMSDKNMDITDDVIGRLNTKLPTVTLNVAAGSAPAPAQAPAKAAAPAKK